MWQTIQHSLCVCVRVCDEREGCVEGGVTEGEEKRPHLNLIAVVKAIGSNFNFRL